MGKPAGRSRLVLYLALGVVAGAAYAGLNTIFDVLDRERPLVAFLGALHGFVDRGIPILTGALAGLGVHYLRVREELARVAAAHAEDLRLRLDGVERDQAVWVVAASTLHDAKNPLHNIGLLLDELEQTSDGAARAELLARSRAHLARIDASLNALRRPVDPRPVDTAVPLGAIVEQVLVDLQSRIDEAGVELSVRPSAARVRGDGGYVRVIVENLVTNAIESLRQNDATRHLTLATETVEDEVRLRISDDGPGLTAAVEPFTPLSTDKARGLGLGLPIARALARAMGGELSLVPRSGRDTTFLLTLRKGAS